MNKGLAPVLLFTYARPPHTKQVLDALKANSLALQTDLIIFADAPKSDKDKEAVKAVREIIDKVTGFNSVKVINRTVNYGLAKNIIEGVSSIIKYYGKVIVLEDDLVTSPYFLAFMNLALDKYQQQSSVWHISGWNYPLDMTELGDAFFWRVMNCWGWATWADRWQFFNKDPQRLVSQWSGSKIDAFDLAGAYDFWGQVKGNLAGQINTWAIFWYATIFEHKGLCLNPTTSFVKNIGMDGTGEHCLVEEDQYEAKLLRQDSDITLPELYQENKKALTKIKAFYKEHASVNSLWRLLRRIKRYLLH